MKRHIKFKDLLEEDKNKINEGVVSSLLGKLITFMMSGTVKQIDSLIDPQKRRDVADAAVNLRKLIDKYNKSLENPEVKKNLESTGKNIEDFYIKEL